MDIFFLLLPGPDWCPGVLEYHIQARTRELLHPVLPIAPGQLLYLTLTHAIPSAKNSCDLSLWEGSPFPL